MKKITLIWAVGIMVLVVLAGCAQTSNFEPAQTNTNGIKLDLLDDKTCVEDSNCVVAKGSKFECCSSCSFDAISFNANDERKKWNEQNCNEWPQVSQMGLDIAPDRYKSCFEYGECVMENEFIAICDNRVCKIKERVP